MSADQQTLLSSRLTALAGILSKWKARIATPSQTDLVDVGKVPDRGEGLLREPGLEEQVAGLHRGQVTGLGLVVHLWKKWDVKYNQDIWELLVNITYAGLPPRLIFSPSSERTRQCFDKCFDKCFDAKFLYSRPLSSQRPPVCPVADALVKPASMCIFGLINQVDFKNHF